MRLLRVVAGAEHVDLANYAPDEYRSRLLDFFAKTVRGSADQTTARSMPSTAASTMKSMSSGVMQNGGMK